MRIGVTQEDAVASQRQYTANNRQEWKSMGYRMFTTQVHDDDRALVLSEVEVRKFQRMVNMVQDPATDANLLYKIAMRNMAKKPTDAARKAVTEKGNLSESRKEIDFCLQQYRYYLRRHDGVRSKYNPEAEYEDRIRAEAKGVAFMNLAVAYFKLATTLVENSGIASVFGLNVEGTDDV